MATTDPEELPEKATTWYLVSNLPTPGSKRAEESDLTAADLAEIVRRLYGLRMWVEQSYKQVKHLLGWSDYQVSRAIWRSAATGSWCAVHSRFAGGPVGSG